MDSVFTVQQLLERHTEHNTETQLLITDYVKAFYSVLRKKLWEMISTVQLHAVEL
jgi:hypothetical protein